MKIELFEIYLQGVDDFKKPTFLLNYENKIEINDNKINFLKIKNKDNNFQNQEKEIIMKKLDKLEKVSWRLRKDGRLEIRFYRDRKCYSIFGKTQNEVLEKYKKWKPIKKSKKTITINNVQTFNEWYNEWLELYKTNIVSNSTLSGIKYSFNKHVLPVIGNTKLTNIKTEDIQKLINKMETLKRQQTITFNFLNNCFKKALKLTKIKINPCENVEFKRFKSISKGKALTITEQNKVEQYLKDNHCRLHVLFLLYLKTGMRRQEGQNINGIKDVNRKENLLHVRGTKTKKSDRILPFNKEIINLIPKEEKPFNFNLDELSRKFKDICTLLNISGISLHSTRHTFATRSIENGTPIEIVQYYLGHSTYKMTADTYYHNQLDNVKKHVEKLPKI